MCVLQFGVAIAYSACENDSPKDLSLCHTLFPQRILQDAPDPAIILITLAVLIGSFCLLSGFVLLCAVSKAWQDETSEAILLMGECYMRVVGFKYPLSLSLSLSLHLSGRHWPLYHIPLLRHMEADKGAASGPAARYDNGLI